MTSVRLETVTLWPVRSIAPQQSNLARAAIFQMIRKNRHNFNMIFWVLAVVPIIVIYAEKPCSLAETFRRTVDNI
jgi:hypothetical protein